MVSNNMLVNGSPTCHTMYTQCALVISNNMYAVVW
jgi:hypothetical protein